MPILPEPLRSDRRARRIGKVSTSVPTGIATALLRDLAEDEDLLAFFEVGLSLTQTAVLSDRCIRIYSTTGRIVTRFDAPLPMLDTPPDKLHLRHGDRILKLWSSDIPEPRLRVPSHLVGRALPPQRRPFTAGRVVKTVAGLCVAGFVGSAVVVGVYESATELSSGASEAFATPAAPSATPSPVVRTTYPMPDLVGESMEGIASRLRGDVGDAFDEYDEWDLSPRGREIFWDSNWTIAATVPAAGEDIPREGTIHIFFLRDEEYAWFKKHPTMPALKKGVRFYEQKVLDDVDELLETRYARGFGPRNAPRQVGPLTYSPSPSVWPNPAAELKREWKPRSKFRVADYPELVVASLPRAGQPLRMGQLITILVRPEPVRPVSPTPGGDTDLYYGNSDDDDDFNIPGSLCPTRFC